MQFVHHMKVVTSLIFRFSFSTGTLYFENGKFEHLAESITICTSISDSIGVNPINCSAEPFFFLTVANISNFFATLRHVLFLDGEGKVKIRVSKK